jgi:uncharacterized protein YeaC (DUF1315 family)
MHLLPAVIPELFQRMDVFILLGQEPPGVPLKDLWLEILITAAMVGWVLFAVCRSSPRN